MNIDAFLTCLGYYGVSTGASNALEGAYVLASGYSGVFYNQLYATGAHFVNGRLYGPTQPLINVYNNSINNNLLTGNNGVRVGYSHSGDFGVLMDIEYSGCTRPVQQKGMILLTTASTPLGLNSGFLVGITESNTLYFETSGYKATLGKELSTRGFVYVGLSEKRYVTFGCFDLNDNVLYDRQLDLGSGRLDSNDIYLGHFLAANSNTPYTGFSGRLYQSILFKETLTERDVGICSNCALVSGYNKITTNFPVLMAQITGWFYSGITGTSTTGYTNVTGQVVTHDATTIDVIFPSGITNQILIGQMLIPAFSGVTGLQARDTYAFMYDNAALNTFSTFSVYFNQPLSSGDSIEIYTYPQPNTKIGKRLIGIQWPDETGVVQLIANGLNETLDVDYTVSRNEIIGETSDDVLSYDVLVANSIITAYSGYWTGDSKIAMSGGGFFPPAPQFTENGANYTGVVKITGMNKVCTGNPFFPNFGYDLHVNGQKLISGMQYSITPSGTSGFVVSLSGYKLPPLIVWPIFDTGGYPLPTGIADVEDTELAFIPQYSGFQQARIDVVNVQNSFGYFTGFAEQVWVNGIRQLGELDYQKLQPCSLTTGAYNPPELPFIMYQSDIGNDAMWNLQPPPEAKNLVNTYIGPTYQCKLTYSTSVPSSYPTGNYIETWLAASPNGNIWENYILTGMLSTSASSFDYNCPDTYCKIKLKYRFGNYIGPETISNAVSTA